MSVILLLLSRFSRVRLRATPEMAAHQASPSLGLSRQEHWSGLPFPSPMHESEKWKWSHSVMSDSSDPMDCSPPGSSVHGIFQAKVVEWGAIALSSQWSYYYCIPITMCSPFFFLLAFVLCIWMLILGAYILMNIISSSCFDPYIIIQCPFFIFLCGLVLKSIWSYMRTATPTFLSFPLS